jgi:predicted RNA methylase
MASARSAARTLDQFYTRPDVARDCIERLNRLLGPREGARWIEPAAGAGAFLDLLPADAIALDLAPQRADIERADFLRWQPGEAGDWIVVGNPPFGKNSSLALKFFNHAATFASVVALILPRTFQKESVLGKLHPNMHLRAEFDLPYKAFLFAGEAYDVPTVFQIWEQGEQPRIVVQRRLSHPDFRFVTAELADFAFQRVGARAGLVSEQGLRKSAQSHYFIKASGEPHQLLQRLRAIDWHPVKTRTAGNPSIGKSELIALYEAAYPPPS